MALSADRVLGSRHLHLTAMHAPHQRVGDLDGHRYAPAIFDPSAVQAVEHTDLQRHEHEAGLAGVIHWIDDDSTSSPYSQATLVRSVHDLDLLIPQMAIPSAVSTAPD